MALTRKVVITSHTLPCSYHFPHITLLPGSRRDAIQADLISVVGGWVGGGQGVYTDVGLGGGGGISVEERARILLYFWPLCL